MRRDLLDFSVLVGAVLNAAAGKLLKSLLRQPRPSAMQVQLMRFGASSLGLRGCSGLSICRCALLGVCESYGMPSSHTQVMAYSAAAHLALTFALPQQRRLAVLLSVAEFMTLSLLAVAVGIARIYLGYHSLWQVLFGGLIGASFGWIWTNLTLLLLKRHGSWALRFPFAADLGLTNYSSGLYQIKPE